MEQFTFNTLRIAVRPDGTIFYGKRKWHEGTVNPTTGYHQVVPSYNCKTYQVHRLVARAFVPNPNIKVLSQVDHIDHNPDNNKASNLRWVTSSLNNLARPFRNYTRGKWGYKSCVTFEGKRYNLGWSKNPTEATLMAQDFKELLFHIGYLQHCKDEKELWEKSYRSYLHGESSNLAGSIERLDNRVRRYRNLRRSLLLLPNSYSEAARILKRFSHLTTKDNHGK